MITVLKFYADWCKPCQNLQPTMDKLKEEFPDVIFSDINIDDDPNERAKYNIRSIPALVIVRDTEEVSRKSSAPYSELKDWINEHRGV